MDAYRQFNGGELLSQRWLIVQITSRVSPPAEENRVDHCFILHVLHDSRTRMIAQGTDGLSQGSFLEGVMTGRDMLSYVDLAKGAIEHQPTLVDYVQSWVKKALCREARVLQAEEWFQEGHGISGGSKDAHGVWIPTHELNGRVYLWNPPPVADVALEKCMKAVHK